MLKNNIKTHTKNTDIILSCKSALTLNGIYQNYNKTIKTGQLKMFDRKEHTGNDTTIYWQSQESFTVYIYI